MRWNVAGRDRDLAYQIALSRVKPNKMIVQWGVEHTQPVGLNIFHKVRFHRMLEMLGPV